MIVVFSFFKNKYKNTQDKVVKNNTKLGFIIFIRILDITLSQSP